MQKPLAFVKKTIVITFVIVMGGLTMNGQNWLWAQQGTANEGQNTAIDRSGNVYITASFGSYGAVFGTDSLVSAPFEGTDALVKYSPLGDLLWAKGIIIGNETGFSVATDIYNNVVVEGSFNIDSVVIGDKVLYTHGNIDSGTSNIFLAKFDSAGVVLWAQCIGGTKYEGTQLYTGNSIATDNYGNIYISGGLTSPQVQIGSFTLSDTNTYLGVDLFVAKFDPDGNALWAQQSSTDSSGAVPTGLSVDNSGNVYVTGYMEGNVTFGSMNIANNNPSNYSMFLVKYNSAGQLLWAWGEDLGSSANQILENINVVATTDNQVYMSGVFVGQQLNLAPLVLNSGTNTSSFFIAKFDSSGMAIWAKCMTSAYSVNTTNICSDIWGNLYFAGGFNQSINLV